jgi:hypothetical protein
LIPDPWYEELAEQMVRNPDRFPAWRVDGTTIYKVKDRNGARMENCDS